MRGVSSVVFSSSPAGCREIREMCDCSSRSGGLRC